MLRLSLPFLLAAVASPIAILSTSLTAQSEEVVQVFDSNITLENINSAQQGWCNALLAISKKYQDGGPLAAKALAESVIDQAYAYQFGPVAFKPTYAVGESTFRYDRAGALAYFVGPDPDIKQFGPNQGFATYRHWKTCKVINNTVQLLGNTANTIGLVKLTDSNGVEGMVEKTWTFWQPKPGVVRIILHHSSAPFNAR